MAADTKQFVQIDTVLLQEAKETIKFVFMDGENEIAFNASNLPPEVDYKNPYNFDLTHFIPDLEVLTLDRFFELAKRLIEDACTRSGQPLVALVEEYPPIDMAKMGNEVVTYKVISREPANMSADGNSRPVRTFRHEYSGKDKNVGDGIIEVLARPLDHEIEFTCWALSNKLANKRAVWLENLFIVHSWVFTSNGAERFHFIRRLADGYLTTGQQRLLYSPLRFFLRFNDFISISHYEIKNIEVNLKLTTEI